MSHTPFDPRYDDKLFTAGERRHLIYDAMRLDRRLLSVLATARHNGVAPALRRLDRLGCPTVMHYEAVRSRINELAGVPSNHGVVA